MYLSKNQIRALWVAAVVDAVLVVGLAAAVITKTFC